MRPLVKACGWQLCVLSVVCLCTVGVRAQEKKRLTFEQIFNNAEPRLTEPLPEITGWADDDHYLVQKRGEGRGRPMTYAVDVKTGKESPYHDLVPFRSLVPEGFDITSFVAEDESLTEFVYTRDKDLFLLNIRSKEFKRLTRTPSEEQNPTISPDGRSVAFTRDGNLFSIDLTTGAEHQYTSDGSATIYNGYASWLYYEEILGRRSRYRAFWWSPDGKWLAFFRFDDSPVPVFPLFRSDGVHGDLEQTRYPEAGDPNPAVRFGTVSVAGGPVVWADFNEKADQYFGTPFWTPDGKQVFVQWMNRDQDSLKLFAVEPASGKKTLVYEEYQPSWVEWFSSIDFLKDRAGFILRTDKDGWNHLYLYGMDGRLRNRLTEGKWSVVDVVLVDEHEGRVLFTGKKEASTQVDLYSVGLDGQGLRRLTFGDFTHTVRVSPGGSWFITTFSNISFPPKTVLCRGDGRVVQELGDSMTKEFGKYLLGKTELFHITTADGYHLPAIWTLPTDFDDHKRYPVIISVYGGPNSPTVSNTWKGIGNQWLAMEGAIQMSVDHRGSGHFGKEGTALMYRNLGKWEMNDYIEAVKWLRRQPFVDSTKICITGGSYGGYVTCLALTEGAEYFTHGIALFSVTDWRLYDSHYVERYMDSPAQNPEGYKNSSVLTYADRYRGMLRIVHGSIDDNVHMQNSLQLVDRLEDLNKHFEFMVYPDERHGWRDVKSAHLRNETYRFYYRYLLEKEFPERLFEGVVPARFERGGRGR